MQYSELSVEQQEALQNLVNPLRSFAAELAQLSNLGIGLAAAWNGGIGDIVASLDAEESIPSTSGLTGARDATKEDVLAFIGYAIDLSNTANNTPGGGYNTAFHRALAVKLAGIVNTSGI